MSTGDAVAAASIVLRNLLAMLHRDMLGQGLS